jgi:hypothetical protein
MFLSGALMLMTPHPSAAQNLDFNSLIRSGPLDETVTACKDSGTNDYAMAIFAADIPPESSDPQTAAASQNPPNPPAATATPPSIGNGFGVLAFLPPPVNQKRLTPKDKFKIYVHQNYGPQNFILPAFSAGFAMLHPPSGYPHEWVDGGGAFGRWYGVVFVSSTVNGTARVLAQVASHEDPRYVPSGSKNVIMRISHALTFTFVDKSDSGGNTFAYSNFAGAAAGGFVGMGFLPAGHDDLSHAEQRALRGLETIAVRNIVTEFRPEWEPTLKKIHIPSILPAWWTPKHSSEP